MTFLTEVETHTRKGWECSCKDSNNNIIVAASIISILHLILWILDRLFFKYIYRNIKYGIKRGPSTEGVPESMREEYRQEQQDAVGVDNNAVFNMSRE
nr:matrix protein 2 [Influenza A virus]